MNLLKLARGISLSPGRNLAAVGPLFSKLPQDDWHTAVRGLFYGLLFEVAAGILAVAVWKLI